MLRDISPGSVEPARPRREGSNSRPMSAPLPRPGTDAVASASRQIHVMKPDDDEFEIQLSPRGSLLAATQDPYDKAERIRAANENLRGEKLPPRSTPSRVRFNEKIRLLDINEDSVMEGLPESITESVESDVEVPESSVKAVHSGLKTLLINVPTGFSEDIDDMASDEGEVSHQPNFRSNTNGQTTEEIESSAVFDEQKEMSDEEDVIFSEGVNNEKEEEEEEGEEEGVDDDDDEEEFQDSDEDVVEDLTEHFQKTCGVGDTEYLKNDQGNEWSGEREKTRLGSPLGESKAAPIVNFAVMRPRTAQTKRQSSVDQLKDVSTSHQNNTRRPSTAPSKRNCQNNWVNIKLPLYNGLRSEYGLSAEQLEERRKRKEESAKAFKHQKEQLVHEQKKRQKENELMFASWLVKKKKEAALKAARRRQNSGIFRLKTLPAPTSHLEKMGAVRKKVLARREHTCYSLEEFFRNAKPHEQRTYRIYLGLCAE